MPLRPKHARFVAEYLKDSNATQAAIRAGYSAKTADVCGPRLLGNVGVRAAIEAGQAELNRKAGLTAELVRKTLARALLFDPKNTVDGKSRARKLQEMDAETRLALEGYEEKPVYHLGKKVGGTIAVKYPDKVAAAMGAARLLGMDKDRGGESVQVSINIGGLGKQAAAAQEGPTITIGGLPAKGGG